MLSKELISMTTNYYNKMKNSQFVVSPSCPILYFGDLKKYLKSELKVITVGKNPSDNEFKQNKSSQYSLHRFPLWNESKMNIEDTLNPYFETNPLKPWFSSFEPILNGLKTSYYPKYKNCAIHTDICSPLATNPTWSKLTKNQKDELFKEGYDIWKKLVEELQPDIMLVSIPTAIVKKYIASKGEILLSFDKKKNGKKRKKVYQVVTMNNKLDSGKQVRVVFGQAANKPFDTISQDNKIQIGEALCQS